MYGFGSMLKDYLDYYKISQTDFANKLNITKKHLNEILNNHTDLSKELMISISLLTNIDIDLIVYTENKKNMYNYLNSNFTNTKEIKKFFNSYYIKEMVKKNWLHLNNVDDDVQTAMDLLHFLNIRNFDIFNDYFNKRVLYKKKDDANMKKVYLWITHCNNISFNQKVNDYDSTKLDDLLKDLALERLKPFNEENLITLFNKYGIYLVIEDSLEGSKVRGCTLTRKDNPAIYMTKYLKEKASFYYALYHEIYHVKKDYNKAKNIILVNESNDEQDNDNFALEEMISSNIWHNILSDLDNKETICNHNDIPLCFLYSRLANAGILKYNDKEVIAHRENI